MKPTKIAKFYYLSGAIVFVLFEIAGMLDQTNISANPKFFLLGLSFMNLFWLFAIIHDFYKENKEVSDAAT